MFKPLLTATLLALALSLPAAECKHRGVWFWQDAGYGPTRAVDIQSYVKWREAIAAGPVIPVAVAFSLVSPLLGGEIVFEAEPISTYIVLHSFNLCHWQEILRVKSQQSGLMAVPIRFDNSQGFWRIESFTEP